MALSLRGTASGTASSSSALTVAKPSGVVAGDLLIIFGAALNCSLGGAAGFAATAAATSGHANARAYWRSVTGTEGSSFTILLSSASYVGAAICAAYAGPASIDPPSIPPCYVHASNTASIPVPGITLASSGDWLAWFGAGVDTAVDTPWTFGLPSGFTSRLTVPAFNNGTDSMAMAFGDIETAQAAGATGTQAGTTSQFRPVAGWLVGISPAAPAAPGLSPGAFLDFFP